MTTIKLSQGKEAIIDEADYESVSKYKWTYCINKKDGHQFVIHGWAKGSGKKNLYLGRYIVDAPDHLEVDHINQNPLDNRRSNLRLATRSQNAANIRKRSDNTTGYKGISFDKSRNKFIVIFTNKGKQKNLGRFDDIRDAIKVRNEAAKEAFGEFATPNPLA